MKSNGVLISTCWVPYSIPRSLTEMLLICYFIQNKVWCQVKFLQLSIKQTILCSSEQRLYPETLDSSTLDLLSLSTFCHPWCMKYKTDSSVLFWCALKFEPFGQLSWILCMMNHLIWKPCPYCYVYQFLNLNLFFHLDFPLYPFTSVCRQGQHCCSSAWGK